MIVALVLREWRDAGTFIINACNKGSASPHHMLRSHRHRRLIHLAFHHPPAGPLHDPRAPPPHERAHARGPREHAHAHVVLGLLRGQRVPGHHDRLALLAYADRGADAPAVVHNELRTVLEHGALMRALCENGSGLHWRVLRYAERGALVLLERVRLTVLVGCAT